MFAQLFAFWCDEDGATAIEYSLIAVVIITGLTALGGGLNGQFDRINNELTLVSPAAGNGGNNQG